MLTLKWERYFWWVSNHDLYCIENLRYLPKVKKRHGSYLLIIWSREWACLRFIRKNGRTLCTWDRPATERSSRPTSSEPGVLLIPKAFTRVFNITAPSCELFVLTFQLSLIVNNPHSCTSFLKPLRFRFHWAACNGYSKAAIRFLLLWTHRLSSQRTR